MKKIYAVAILAFILRLLWLRKNLFFGFEQGRDFLKLSEIASGNLVLIGPKTDIDGIFHGALSYYLPLPSFLVFQGSPFLVLVSFIAVHAISVVFLFKFAREAVNKKYAFIVAFLYAISYSSIVYSRWLGNPNLVPALTIFMLYCLQQAKEKKYFLVLAAGFWVTIFHLQLIAAVILVIPFLYYVVSERLGTKKSVVASTILVAVLLSSYILFNFKNDNILVNSLNRYISSSERASGKYNLDEFYNETVDNYFPESRNIALFVFAVVVTVNLINTKEDRHSRFLLVLFILAPLVFYVLHTSALRHLYMLNSLFASLMVANTARFFWERRYYAFFVVVLLVYSIGNISAIFSRLPESNRNFIHHAQRTYLRDELALIDYIYADAGGEKFSYDYFTVPYWQPQAWQYLFKWYGQDKHKYTPEPNRTSIYYVLIEPDEGQPQFQKDWYTDLESKGKLLDEYSSGKLKVEKRQEI